MRFSGVVAVAVAISTMAYPGSARTVPDERIVTVALRHCLTTSSGAMPPPSETSSIPPGLIDGRDVSLQPLATRRFRAYSYIGTKRQVISCGIAMYGPVPARLYKALAALIESDDRWRSESPEYWQTSTPAAEARYWGEPRAQGLLGVLMLRRRSGEEAPSLEVQYHSVPLD